MSNHFSNEPIGFSKREIDSFLHIFQDCLDASGPITVLDSRVCIRYHSTFCFLFHFLVEGQVHRFRITGSLNSHSSRNTVGSYIMFSGYERIFRVGERSVDVSILVDFDDGHRLVSVNRGPITSF